MRVLQVSKVLMSFLGKFLHVKIIINHKQGYEKCLCWLIITKTQKKVMKCTACCERSAAHLFNEKCEIRAEIEVVFYVKTWGIDWWRGISTKLMNAEQDWIKNLEYPAVNGLHLNRISSPQNYKL